MKKLISVLLVAVMLLCSVSVGLICFAVEGETTTSEIVETTEDDGRIDLTEEGGKDHTTLWRIFAQLWIEIYYFFVDIIAMARA